MNAIELFHKDGKTSGVFYCEKCRIVKRTKAEADKCCGPVFCRDCGNEVKHQYTFRPISVQCDACSSAEFRRREQIRFDKAEKLTEWDGPVFCDGFGNNGYAETLCEMIDYIKDEEGEKPEYVWACTVKRFVTAEASDITERICDAAYEDFDPDDLDGLDDLNEAIRVFNEKNAAKVVWNPDFSKAILLNLE